jgi:formylmethanofuran dehydrogenase subunit E
MNVKNEWFCEGCGDFINSGEMRYTADGVLLCEVCYEEWNAVQQAKE